MKKIPFILFALIALTVSCLGQFSEKGIKFGLNFATVGGPDAKNPDPHSITNINAGIFATFDLIGLVSIQPEVLYSSKGFQVSDDVGNYTFHISYLEIPLLVKVNLPFTSLGNIKPNILIGPEIAFNLSGVETIEVTGQSSQQQDMHNLTKTDYGFIFGIGADVKLIPIVLIVDFRYDFGLKTISSLPNPLYIVNRVFSINVGVGF